MIRKQLTNKFRAHIRTLGEEYKQRGMHGAKAYYRRILCKLLRHRQFQAYCVGAPRTGTSSIAGLFGAYYRSGHEVDSENVLKFSLDYLEGKIDADELDQFIIKRDKKLFLEMDSSTHNFYMIPALLRLFPNAKFLIPIRDPISWLDSYIDYSINNRLQANTNVISPQRMRMNLFRHGNLYHEYTHAEKILQEFEMPSIEAFLFFYKDHYETILKIIPENCCIIYNTFELEEKIPNICRLLGIRSSALSMTNLKLNKRKKRHHVLAGVDPAYLQERVDFYCGDLMRRFYPNTRVTARYTEKQKSHKKGGQA